MPYPRLYAQNARKPVLLTDLPEGVQYVDLTDSGKLSCSVSQVNRVWVLSIRFELRAPCQFFLSFPAHSFLAVYSRKAVCHILFGKRLQTLIPQHCGQVIHAAGGKIRLSLTTGRSEMILVYFPVNLINRLKNHYLLLQEFLKLSKQGKNAILFPFPRILHDGFIKITKEIGSTGWLLGLWSGLFKELEPATAEWLSLEQGRTDGYDDEKFYHVILLLLISPGQRITTSQLARKVQLNEYRLKRGFKQKFNMSLHAFHENIRIEKAKTWIRENTQSLSRIAAELGYSSPSHFSAAFKKGTGLRPEAYRRMFKQMAGNANGAHPG